MKNTLRVKQLTGAAFLVLMALASLACQSKKTTTTTELTNNTVSAVVDSWQLGQAGGSQVMVDKAILSRPAFIVIYEINNGQPGKVMGYSSVISGGTNTNIRIVGNRLNVGWQYISELYYDNGDASFNATDDQLARDAQNNPLMVKFLAGEPFGEEAGPQLREFTVTAKKYAFEPAILQVNKNDKVKISLTTADIKHGFYLPDFGINKEVSPGTTEVIEFTADHSGDFPFFNSVYSGPGYSSMIGHLIVK